MPDFELPELGFFIEVKGRLDSSTRKKMRDVKASNPDKDIRLLLLQDNKLQKNKKERYSDWCVKYGYQYTIKKIPKGWLKKS